MKRFCNECNRTTKHTKKKVGSEREPFFSLMNLIFTVMTGGLYIIFHILFSKVNFYDIFCKECNMGHRGIPD